MGEIVTADTRIAYVILLSSKYASKFNSLKLWFKD